jgi:hypothetical protein
MDAEPKTSAVRVANTIIVLVLMVLLLMVLLLMVLTFDGLIQISLSRKNLIPVLFHVHN